MRRLMLAGLLLGVLPVSVSAQTQVFSAVAQCGAAADMTLSSNGDSFVCGTRGYASARLQTLDTYSGTWEAQCSVDGTNYDATNELPVTLLGGVPANSVTDTVGIWDVNVAGCQSMKIIATAGFAASDVTFVVRALATGGGSAGSGAVTQGTDPWIVAGGGTAGSAATGVVTVQGIACGTAVTVAPSSGSFATDTTHDSAASATGPQIMTVAAAYGTLPTAVTAADAVRTAADLQGVVYVRSPTDPCNGVAKSYHVVNMSTATTVEIANAVSGQYWHICAVNLVAAAAQTIAIGIDDTDGCGSITTGLAGGATAATGWSFAANGGITLGNGMGTVLKSATSNQYLCVITGQAAQISGTIVYVSAP